MVLAADPKSKDLLIIIVSWSLQPLHIWIVSRQIDGINLIIARFLELIDFFLCERGRADSFDTHVQLAMNTGACHADKGAKSHVDALGQFGGAIRAFLIAALQCTKLLFRRLLRLATI